MTVIRLAWNLQHGSSEDAVARHFTLKAARAALPWSMLRALCGVYMQASGLVDLSLRF